ncbi:sigma factor-like helix-turn-helix DNA-binding protein [Alienimonas californiensis]|uniref:Sigma-70, region 4 n=1 Tax=Alienimonas californiensis TaxID=2527989 RepID=A0A517PBP4_9PLAN|nr:sigma factor-like helix-turn-helix DNA-binding protein [Alienimonas californiensis]QDT16781.1 Sigma-70, region 4 [Alienimonas californiensis]
MLPEDQYRQLRNRLLDVADDVLLDRSLREWAAPHDRLQLAPSLCDRPLREVFNLKFQWLAARRGVDDEQIVSFLMLLRQVVREAESSVDSPSVGELEDWQHAGAVRYDHLRAELAGHIAPEQLDRPLRDWSNSGDTHLPKALVDQPLSEVLRSDFLDLTAPREIGRRRAEKFLDLLERAIKTEPGVGHPDDSLDDPAAAYERVRRQLLSLADQTVLARALRSWPRFYRAGLSLCFADPPISDLLSDSYADHALKNGVGPLRLEKFIEVLEELCLEVAVRDQLAFTDGLGEEETDAAPVRGETPLEVVFEALTEVEESAKAESSTTEKVEASSSPPSTAEVRTRLPQSPERLDESAWRHIHDLFVRHHLAPQPVGRFAVSLAELPRTRWRDPIGEYTGQPLEEFRDAPGVGPTRFRQIADILLRVAAPLDQPLAVEDPREGLTVQVLPTRVARVRTWIDDVLASEARPSAAIIAEQFLEPLLEQIGWDLGFETAECLRGRLGLDGAVLTLQTLAEEFGLSRERIRQLTARASDVLGVRWPEARHLLDDFYEHFRPYADAADAAALVGRTMDLLFNVEVSGDETPEEVLEKWRKVGRSRCTPFTTDELLSWAAGACPGVKPEIARGWIDAACPALPSGGLYAEAGETLHFTEEPLDRLLVRLIQSDEPMHLRDAAALVESEERSLKGRLDRDLRFLRDEFGRVAPSGRYRLSRRGDLWEISLPAVEGSASSGRTMSLEALRTLILSGLSSRGIHDATAWGVHRFAQETLRRLFGVTLPPGLDQFLLADVLVQESGGDVRPMRRRRLRWNEAGGTATALGKRGWVCRTVAEAGGPVTLGEIGVRLARYYQDYEPYVIGQLPSAFEGRDDEEGENPHAIRFEGAGPLPTVAVPEGWTFDTAQMNVSPGVLKAAYKASSRRFNSSDQVPAWFEELLKEVRLGHVAEPTEAVEDEIPPAEEVPPNEPAPDHAFSPPSPQPLSTEELDEALAGLF